MTYLLNADHATLTRVTATSKFELEIGFDLSVGASDAADEATRLWLAAVERAGKKPTDGTVLVLNRDSALEGIGQFSVIVSGAVTDGDQ